MNRLAMIVTRSVSLTVLILSAVLIFGCKEDGATAAAQAKKQQEQSLQELEKSFRALKADSSHVVDFRILKEAMPEQLAGMKRTASEGQKSGFAGLTVSTAEATYEDGDRKMTISLMDTGGLGSVIAGIASWSQIEIDKEDDNGYERTTMIDGSKAYEKYDRTNKSGTLSLISADRFVVSINGDQIEESDLRIALSKIKVRN